MMDFRYFCTKIFHLKNRGLRVSDAQFVIPPKIWFYEPYADNSKTLKIVTSVKRQRSLNVYLKIGFKLLNKTDTVTGRDNHLEIVS